MRAELKRLHSPDADPLHTYRPADSESFGIFVQAIVGPAGEEGEESFDFMLCTPHWLASRPSEIILGQHHLIVRRFDYGAIEKFVSDFCARCEGATWNDVAHNVTALGRWEFDDYRA
jgi:hypothetical protein